jgi:AcrR family transcriptional regulator
MRVTEQRRVRVDTLPETRLGRRERKKLQTRALIQREALRLFLEKGFEATTIEEIAEAADIAPSTFFNYFPTKENVVLQDDLDPVLLEALHMEPTGLGPIAVLRKAIHHVFSHLTPEQHTIFQRRLALLASNLPLRAAFLNQSASQLDEIVALVAERTGCSSDDFVVRNLAGALFGVMTATFLSAANDSGADVLGLADQALAHLEAGLPLDWPVRE